MSSDGADVLAGLRELGRTPADLRAGDALALIGCEVRFMARPVTLDLPAARRTMEECLRFQPDVVCPGHREPLTGARAACESMLRT